MEIVNTEKLSEAKPLTIICTLLGAMKLQAFLGIPNILNECILVRSMLKANENLSCYDNNYIILDEPENIDEVLINNQKCIDNELSDFTKYEKLFYNI